MELTREELREAVRDGVADAFVMVGIEVDKPHEMQADFLHLRQMRVATEAVKRKSILTLIGLVVTAVVGFACRGLLSVLHS